ncbi:MAG TPA: hypothetical protein VGA56_26075 [Opitutaceae bacterium]
MIYATKDHVLARNTEGAVEFWLIGDQVYRCDNLARHDLFGRPRNRAIECSLADWQARRGDWWWAQDVSAHYLPFATGFR